jgi:hypothetical protein
MFYSQCDPKWKNVRLGTCPDTIGQSGCFMTSLANLAWKVPVEVNELFTRNGAYVNGCLISPEKAAQLLGLEYKGKTTVKPDGVCIAETNYYASRGVPQHFFIWNPDGRIADPLDLSPDWQENKKKYPIVSYRLFRAKNAIKTSSPSADASAKPSSDPALATEKLSGQASANPASGSVAPSNQPLLDSGAATATPGPSLSEASESGTGSAPGRKAEGSGFLDWLVDLIRNLFKK